MRIHVTSLGKDNCRQKGGGGKQKKRRKKGNKMLRRMDGWMKRKWEATVWKEGERKDSHRVSFPLHHSFLFFVSTCDCAGEGGSDGSNFCCCSSTFDQGKNLGPGCKLQENWLLDGWENLILRITPIKSSKLWARCVDNASFGNLSLDKQYKEQQS